MSWYEITFDDADGEWAETVMIEAATLGAALAIFEEDFVEVNPNRITHINRTDAIVHNRKGFTL